MLSLNANVKIIDFGLSIMRREDEKEVVQMAGSPHYISPEMMRMRPHSFPTDIWSMGVVLAELAAQEDFTQRDPLAAMYGVARHGLLSPSLLPPSAHPEMVRFISSCLSVDPSDRSVVSVLSRHTFLSLRCGREHFQKQVCRCFVGRVLQDIGLDF